MKILAVAAVLAALLPSAVAARDVAPKDRTTTTTTVTTREGATVTTRANDPDRASVEADAARVDQRSAEIAAKARARSGGAADRPAADGAKPAR